MPKKNAKAAWYYGRPEKDGPVHLYLGEPMKYPLCQSRVDGKALFVHVRDRLDPMTVTVREICTDCLVARMIRGRKRKGKE